MQETCVTTVCVCVCGREDDVWSSIAHPLETGVGGRELFYAHAIKDDCVCIVCLLTSDWRSLQFKLRRQCTRVRGFPTVPAAIWASNSQRRKIT